MDNKIEELIITSFHNEIRAIVKYENGRVDPVATLDGVNNVIGDFMKQTRRSLDGLFSDRKVIIDPDKADFIRKNFTIGEHIIVKKDKTITRPAPLRPATEDIPPIPIPHTSDELDEPIDLETETRESRHRRSERREGGRAKDISQSIDYEEILDEVIRLNPDIDVRMDYEGRSCYSEVPGDELVLPRGFYYSEKNGITNKGRTRTGAYAAIPVYQLEYEDDEEEEEEYEEPTRRTRRSKKHKKSWVKRIAAVAGAATIIAVGIHHHHKFCGGAKDAASNNGLDTKGDITAEINIGKTIEEPDDTMYVAPTITPIITPTSAPILTPVEEHVFSDYNIVQPEEVTIPTGYTFQTGKYAGYGSIVSEDSMESQINDINKISYYNISDLYMFVQNGQDLSGKINPCNLQNLVIEDDKDAVRKICAGRNSVIANAYNERNTSLTNSDVYMFLNEYANYVFDGRNYFNANYIKKFNDLSPYSKYIVSVMGQAVLQLYQNYDMRIGDGQYSYGDFTERLNNLVNETYSILIDADIKTR